MASVLLEIMCLSTASPTQDMAGGLGELTSKSSPMVGNLTIDRVRAHTWMYASMVKSPTNFLSKVSVAKGFDPETCSEGLLNNKDSQIPYPGPNS